MSKCLLFTISFHVYLSYILCSCAPPAEYEPLIASTDTSPEQQSDEFNIIPAAERTALYYAELKGKKVACVVNQTSMVGDKHLIDTLKSMEIDVRKIFALEHGFRGSADDGEEIKDGVDTKTGIPIISLYGSRKKPTKADLSGIDVVLFDIQDVGARCYTFISSSHYVMESCAENEVPLIILDRPNPNGFYVDGPVLEEEFNSFVAVNKIPLVYGLTIGELAIMINEEAWLAGGVKADLKVIQCKNYTHKSYYDLPIKPSPNLPNSKAVLLYPSLVFFEGTVMSIGRGTNMQFQIIGHPDITDKYFSFTPKPGEGSIKPKHDGALCYGEDLRSLTIGGLMENNKIRLDWLLKYHSELSSQNIPFFLETNYIDKLAGTDKLQKQIRAGWNEEQIRESWEPELSAFKQLRKKYLLYPD